MQSLMHRFVRPRCHRKHVRLKKTVSLKEDNLLPLDKKALDIGFASKTALKSLKNRREPREKEDFTFTMSFFSGETHGKAAATKPNEIFE